MPKKCHLIGWEIVLDRKCCIDDGGFGYKTSPTIIIRISKFTLYVLRYQVSLRKGEICSKSPGKRKSSWSLPEERVCHHTTNSRNKEKNALLYESHIKPLRCRDSSREGRNLLAKLCSFDKKARRNVPCSIKYFLTKKINIFKLTVRGVILLDTPSKTCYFF